MRFRSGLLLCLIALAVTPTAAEAAPIGAYTTKGAWSFVSAPGLHPPKLHTDAPTLASKLVPGDFLLSNFPNVGASGPMTGEGGPMIVDNRLQPVWFDPVGTGVVAANLEQETYKGKPVLVWWQGLVTSTGVTIKGQVVVVDQHYHRVALLKARRPWVVSLHDAVIDGSSIWVTVYRNVPGQNLKRYHGAARASVLDAGVQEYDLGTGKLIRTWDALKHVPLSDSRQPAPTASGAAWDAYHVNSVQPLPGNQVLVSLRNTWGVYLIDSKTGHIVWTLGGRHSSFKGPSSTHFAWQHDVQLLSNGELTMFNDNCCAVLANGDLGRSSGPSAGTVLELNVPSRAVSLVKAFVHHPTRDTAFLGSMQLLMPSGNAVVGYGSLPYFSEYDASGRLLLDVVFPRKDQSYRARFSSTWVGLPSSPPSGQARRHGGTTTVYGSWNGATQVEAWELLGGPSASKMTQITTKPRGGFETSLTASGSTDKVFELVALDAEGHTLGASKPFTAH